MKNYIHKSINIGIVYTKYGVLWRIVTLGEIDKVEWEGIRHQIPYYEDELNKKDYEHYISD